MAYDELGQLKAKKLAPGYNNNAGIETLVYDYNIRGWMLGVNRDYLLAEGQTGTSKFGFELGYDKPTNKTGQNFSNTVQYNGNIAGMTWKSDGDDVRRMYSFGYDGANRLLKGDFVQQNPEDHSWNNTRINYSMQMGNGTDGRTAYDANGNILSMTQYGWKLGAGASTPIDKLTYNYTDGSNRLKAVLDEVNDPMTKLGDFRTSGTHPFAAYKTPANTWVTDYSYDANGNLTTDYNKDINPIAYNHLNLPSVIYTNKGTITYTYDAAGNKLEKKVTEGTTLSITTYLGGAVYQSKGVTGAPGPDGLQFIGHEEGRMRVDASNTTTPNPYDYMLKDHLGNVRMVLTDEQKTDIYPVTYFEGDQSCAQNIYDINTGKIFDKPADSQLNYANNNGFNGSPCGDNAGTNTKMYKLFATSSGADVGLGMTLKVMAGDVINIFGKSYYNAANSSQTNYTTTVAQIVAGLLGVGGTAAVGKGATQPVLNANAGTLAANSFLTDPNRGSGTVPKAYINWVLFDEQFNYVTGGFSRVNGSANSLKDHHSDLNNIPMTKSGYLYIYASNESPVAVFFDNLQVVHTRGLILEETHYYPFGLTMAGISSSAQPNTTPSRIKYNGYEQQHKEFSDGSGLEWYDYKNRFYDNQIGRFFVQDRLANEYVYYTPYQFAGNEVPNAIDLDGLEPYYANPKQVLYDYAAKTTYAIAGAIDKIGYKAEAGISFVKNLFSSSGGAVTVNSETTLKGSFELQPTLTSALGKIQASPMSTSDLSIFSAKGNFEVSKSLTVEGDVGVAKVKQETSVNNLGILKSKTSGEGAFVIGGIPVGIGLSTSVSSNGDRERTGGVSIKPNSNVKVGIEVTDKKNIDNSGRAQLSLRAEVKTPGANHIKIFGNASIFTNY